MCYKDLPFPDADMVSRSTCAAREDEPGVLAKISALFGEHGVSIHSMCRRARRWAELVLLLHPVPKSSSSPRSAR